MFLSAFSVLVVAQLISEIPEGLMNNPVYSHIYVSRNIIKLFPLIGIKNWGISFSHNLLEAVSHSVTLQLSSCLSLKSPSFTWIELEVIMKEFTLIDIWCRIILQV